MGLLRNHPVILSCMILTAFAGGCALLPLFTTLNPAPPFDFAHLRECVNMAVDVTDMNTGWKSDAQLRAKFADERTRAEFVEVPSVHMTCMLLTDDADQRHTIVLPGTSNLIHIVLDLRVTLTYDTELDMLLHTGFRFAALAVRQEVAPRLNPDYEIRVVGYSFGGAVSAILSQYLSYDGFSVVEVVTLGQPALTTSAGAAQLGKLPLLRLISGDDPIVWAHAGGYVQFGEAIILLDGPYVVHLTPDDPEFDLAAKTLTDLNDEQDVDHGLYVPRIESKVGVDVYQVRFIDRGRYLNRPLLVE